MPNQRPELGRDNFREMSTRLHCLDDDQPTNARQAAERICRYWQLNLVTNAPLVERQLVRWWRHYQQATILRDDVPQLAKFLSEEAREAKKLADTLETSEHLLSDHFDQASLLIFEQFVAELRRIEREQETASKAFSWAANQMNRKPGISTGPHRDQPIRATMAAWVELAEVMTGQVAVIDQRNPTTAGILVAIGLITATEQRPDGVPYDRAGRDALREAIKRQKALLGVDGS